MKIKLIFKKGGIQKEHHPIVKKYIHFLQEKLPLKKNLNIFFLLERVYDMTTGGNYEGTIFILTKKRILRDILRTLGHEWVHEYQTTILKKETTQDIGGANENDANAISGKLIKIFEKENPSIEKLLYK